MLYPSMLYPQNNPFRRSVPLDGMWKFCLDPSAPGGAGSWQNGIPGREQIPVPASFQVFTPTRIRGNFAGTTGTSEFLSSGGMAGQADSASVRGGNASLHCLC